MAVRIEIPFHKKLLVTKSMAEVRAFFSNPSTSIGSHFPGLASLTQIQGNRYRWTFDKLSYTGYELVLEIQTTIEPYDTGLKINPVGNSGHTLQADWRFSPEGCATKIELTMSISLDLPVPGLMKGMVQSLAQKELTKLLERFTDNIGKALA